MKALMTVLLGYTLVALLTINSSAAAQCFTATEVTHMTASDGAASDFFGDSVAVAGDRLVVGARLDDTPRGSNTGSVYVFVRAGSLWVQEAKLVASDGTPNDNFGRSVAISGDRIVVGAYSSDTISGSDTGAAYVFRLVGSSWVQEAKLTASDGQAGDEFGIFVSFSDDRALVGARFDSNGGGINAGSAYIFHWSGSAWIQEAKLTASDGAAGDQFGIAVSISGDYALVGAWFDDTDRGIDAGSAYLFHRIGTAWFEEAKLTASDGASSDQFGYWLSLDADRAIVGANAHDTVHGSNAGAAYIYHRVGSAWTEMARLTASDGAANFQFGTSVSISGDLVVVGANGDSTIGGTGAGSAYVYLWTGSEWVQKAKLQASDGAAGDQFGISVSVWGTHAVVGANLDDTLGGTDSGSACAFDVGPIFTPVLVDQPQPATGCYSGTASFSLSATGSSPLQYQWRKGLVWMVNGPNVTGATSPTLNVSNLFAPDAGSYNCVVSNGCGSVVSNAATLTVGLAADISGNNVVNTQDLAILLAFFGGPATHAQGDLNGDGVVTTVDLTVLLAQFGSTCP